MSDLYEILSVSLFIFKFYEVRLIFKKIWRIKSLSITYWRSHRAHRKWNSNEKWCRIESWPNRKGQKMLFWPKSVEIYLGKITINFWFSKVLATGYDLYHYKDQPITANGKNFDDFWSNSPPYAWSGVLHPNFPNYFMMLGILRHSFYQK